MIPQAPELFDGGWWVAVSVVEDDDGMMPDIAGANWAAWYDGSTAYVRTLDPVLVNHPGTVAHKGFARIGGR